MNLICVDDEKIILKNLVSKCREIDFVDEVFSFSSGLKLLEFLDKNPDYLIDAVILDIDMPDITGLSLAKEIKKMQYDALNPDGLVMVVNYGIAQQIKHYHLHLIPVYKNKQQIVSVDDTYSKIMQKKN